MSKGAFNVSTGMNVTIVANNTICEELADFVTTIAEDPDIMKLLQLYEGFEDGIPQPVFSLAIQMRKQARISREFEAGKRNASTDRDVA